MNQIQIRILHFFKSTFNNTFWQSYASFGIQKRKILLDCFVKIWATCKNFFGQMVYRPPWPKIARTPMILKVNREIRQTFMPKCSFFPVNECISALLVVAVSRK